MVEKWWWYDGEMLTYMTLSLMTIWWWNVDNVLDVFCVDSITCEEDLLRSTTFDVVGMMMMIRYHWCCMMILDDTMKSISTIMMKLFSDIENGRWYWKLWHCYTLPGILLEKYDILLLICAVLRWWYSPWFVGGALFSPDDIFGTLLQWRCCGTGGIRSLRCCRSFECIYSGCLRCWVIPIRCLTDGWCLVTLREAVRVHWCPAGPRPWLRVPNITPFILLRYWCHSTRC